MKRLSGIFSLLAIFVLVATYSAYPFGSAGSTISTGNNGATITVANGGTGTTTNTNHGVLVGQGTSPIAATAAGTADQPLVSGGASADPAYAASLKVTVGGTGLVQAASQTISSGTGSVGAGDCAAEGTVTITGITTTSACMVSPGAAPAWGASGATGAGKLFPVIAATSNTATLYLCNPTAGSLTPTAQTVNVKCVL